MTESRRRSSAADAVDQLIEMVRSQGPSYQTWYLMLLDIRDVLASSASDEDALREAGEMFAVFYHGARNFSDFYIEEADKAVQARKNAELIDAVRTLKEATRP